jgi:hypothetical protein
VDNFLELPFRLVGSDSRYDRVEEVFITTNPFKLWEFERACFKERELLILVLSFRVNTIFSSAFEKELVFVKGYKLFYYIYRYDYLL